MTEMPIEAHFSMMKDIHSEILNALTEGSSNDNRVLSIPYDEASAVTQLANTGLKHANEAEFHHVVGDYSSAHKSLLSAAASFGPAERLLRGYRDKNHGLLELKGGIGVSQFGKPWAEVLANSYKQRMDL